MYYNRWLHTTTHKRTTNRWDRVTLNCLCQVTAATTTMTTTATTKNDDHDDASNESDNLFINRRYLFSFFSFSVSPHCDSNSHRFVGCACVCSCVYVNDSRCSDLHSSKGDTRMHPTISNLYIPSLSLSLIQ